MSRNNAVEDRGSSAKNSLDMKTLFVRSIPFEATDEELANYFSELAPIKHAVIVKDSDKNSRGFGFVSFAVEDDTKDALDKARKTKFKGRLLRVDIAKRRERSKGDQKPSSGSEQTGNSERKENELLGGKPKLIIRNMPWSVRKPEQLKQIFMRFGTVVEAKIPKKPDGKLCGFAFVTMKKLAACKKAIEDSKDLKIDGRQVAVDFAIQKNKWEDYKKENVPEKAESDSESESDEQEAEEETPNEASEAEKEDKEDGSDDDNSEVDSEEDKDMDSEEEEEEEINSGSQNWPKPNKQEQLSVFVRNVPYDATQETLEEHFSKFGPVKYALPVQDKETGLAKGSAFVVFSSKDAFDECVNNAPASGTTSLLMSDDVPYRYVYEGRILSISPALDRETAGRFAERNASKRKEAFGKAPTAKDKRNLYLLNEGRITEGSKLAQLITAKDMEIRESSYKLRVEQLKKNPSLHLSLTRLAIRNLPRAMTDKALKALARKAIVEFAKEVTLHMRHPLSKEEIQRSTKEKYKFMDEDEIAARKKKDKKQGVVRQAKVIMEVKGSSIGRSRGYGFVEFRDHKAALMGLRWLNAHEVTKSELLEGLDDEEKKAVDTEGLTRRRLCVEFAIENANVVKRRRDATKNMRESNKRKLEEEGDEKTQQENQKKAKTDSTTKKPSKSGVDDDTKRLIGYKRKRKQARK
ncbi:LAQU0S16e01156g1_1 [Lachancea quebecensis]|uniref:LAQU0S16e01156g1_1 n=1 Tax=Lachancea quebecensis TaxID=1654605 RepID=A0A0P1KYC7_9SACH|nr:LAQU0S16e01156g1_1 [Lachancea quebecensis]